MTKRKARIAITDACPRKCSYCCNEYASLRKLRRTLTEEQLPMLIDYDEVMVTGGEPMLFGLNLISVLSTLRYYMATDAKLYLYTADVRNPTLFQLVADKIDGVQLTLHQNSTQEDILAFEKAQDLIAQIKRKNPAFSARAYLNPAMSMGVFISPYAWDRLEVKPWIPEESCTLPAGEDFFFYNAQ